MPIFRLQCRECGHQFEDFRNIMDREETGKCLKCGSENIERAEALVSDCDCGCGCGAPNISHDADCKR